ncbi:MAG: hypothetical protein EAZ84_10795 [Verrucomicrobia bacterium]|nr:MAG: hypothetical protein EAZ84_10795 [Verrucomicrobiota bacterium]TAE85251.1 MAG: hypothetical protein EAZ82_13435 [Verrucomicrobiota bacterium]TAF23020.1 MAG: hypothetical protein EAZ71_13360 [Verrucomicrobiota bacterium]
MSAETPNSPGSAARNRPALSELSKETTENDLWNLDDESVQGATPLVSYLPMPRKIASVEEVPEEPGEAPPLPTETEEEPAPANKDRDKGPSAHRSDFVPPLLNRAMRPAQSDGIGELDELPELPPEPAPPEEKVAATIASDPGIHDPEASPAEKIAETRPNPPRQNVPRPKINRKDAITLTVFSFTLLVAAIWVLSRFFAVFEFKSQFPEMPAFPAKGQHATLGAAETFWREPIRDGTQRDFARREVAMIPVLQLTLDPSSSSGALLVVFRNAQGEPVGDAIRRSFQGGRFDANSEATIAFPATDGFIEEGYYHAYRTGKGQPWMVEVLEGPTIDAPAENFRPLAPIPVSPLRR